MPRGYLKNCKSAVGKKQSRGGSSHRSFKKDPSSCGWKVGKCNRRCVAYEAPDVCVTAPNSLANKKLVDSATKMVNSFTESNQVCAICLEHVPVLRLFRNCEHASACKPCMRQHYIYHAQSNVAQYPLRCFYPSCNLILQAPQLEKLQNPGSTQSEITKHHRLTTLAKAYRSPDTIVVHCHYCDHPRSIKEETRNVHNLRVFECRSCDRVFGLLRSGQIVDESAVRSLQAQNARDRARVTWDSKAHRKWRRRVGEMRRKEKEKDMRLYRKTIDFLQNLQGDAFGINDGWARCPRCKIIISKGNGCDHMFCVCGLDFSWYEAGGAAEDPYG